MLLTSNGRLQQRLTDPSWGHWRRYWSQVEGVPSEDALNALRSGLVIQGQRTLPAQAQALQDPGWPERDPPIRVRQSIPTSWLQLELREGRNRQVRRMTAAVGLPTLRLLRVAMDLMDGGPPLSLDGLAPGQWRSVNDDEDRRLQSLLQSGRGGRAGAESRAALEAGGRVASPKPNSGDKTGETRALSHGLRRAPTGCRHCERSGSLWSARVDP